MDIQVIPARELSPELILAWTAIQRSQEEFHSPYFCPEFVQAVAQTREDVEVAVLRETGVVVGFFPFERHAWNLAQPVGGRMSDFQAVIARPDVDWTPRELLAGCGLKGWEYDHWLVSQTQFAASHAQTYDSPYLDLRDGFEAYYRDRRAAGSERLIQFQRKLRKLEREVGPLRFVAESHDRELLQQLLVWKEAKYHERQLANPFRQPKALAMLEAFLNHDQPAFAGVLTALYAGDHLVAVLFSLRSYNVWHYSLPAHNEEFNRYSPGSILLTRLAQEADRLGVTRIDLGKGKDEYKDSFASGSTPIAEGSVDSVRLVHHARHAWRRTRDWVKNSHLYAPARRPIRWLRETLDWMRYG